MLHSVKNGDCNSTYFYFNSQVTELYPLSLKMGFKHASENLVSFNENLTNCKGESSKDLLERPLIIPPRRTSPQDPVQSDLYLQPNPLIGVKLSYMVLTLFSMKTNDIRMHDYSNNKTTKEIFHFSASITELEFQLMIYFSWRFFAFLLKNWFKCSF